MTRIATTYITDPGCPWAYSVEPSLQALRWRYGDQLDWRLTMIGLTEQAGEYEERGYSPASMALGYQGFRRYGMPFATQPRERVVATSRACRVVVAARLDAPGLEWTVLRALQFAWFTSTLLLDEDEDLAVALNDVPEIDAHALLGRLDDTDVTKAYEADRGTARSAADSAAALQGKTARTDGPERFTAPTLVFERDGLRLIAGGFQPLEAYDVLIANLETGLDRRPVPDGPLPLLQRFPSGLTSQEVAVLLARDNDAPDRSEAEALLIDLVAEGRASRKQLADDALWLYR